jgi:hypothetical protein
MASLAKRENEIFLGKNMILKKNLNLFIEIKYNKNEVLIQQKDHSYILFNKKNKTLLSLEIHSAVSMIQKLAIQGK